MNKDVGLILGGLLREVKEIDLGPNGLCLGKFLRVRVMVDALSPFKKGLRISLGDSEDMCSVIVCYERLPNFCHFYGKIGHLVRDCPESGSHLLNKASMRYGQWMRAPVPERNNFKWGIYFGSKEQSSDTTKESNPTTGKENVGQNSEVINLASTTVS
ncbi:hypothetical protein ACOSQ2_009871 [Xanthoceras sorbifolium]